MDQTIRGFVPEPNCGRGTIGIIWSSLSTIVLCTYSALHLNLDTGEPRRRQNGFWHHLLYTLGAIIAPELCCLVAIRDFFEARAISYESQKTEVPITISQAHLIIMNGVRIRKVNSEREAIGQTILFSWSKFHSALKISKVWKHFPNNQHIHELSNSDHLSKIVATLQMIWFTTQIIARHVQGKTVSLLEVSTLAYVSMAIFTYLAWIYKPQGITNPVIIEVDETVDLTEIQDSKIFNRVVAFDGRLHSLLWMVLLGIFSGVHCIAWNYPFGSVLQKWLWRICSILCTAFGMSLHIGDFLNLDEISEDRVESVGVVGYLVVRTCLIVLVFMSFRAAPASIYETVNWPSYFPSVG
jgi:hypothetical protein